MQNTCLIRIILLVSSLLSLKYTYNWLNPILGWKCQPRISTSYFKLLKVVKKKNIKKNKKNKKIKKIKKI